MENFDAADKTRILKKKTKAFAIIFIGRYYNRLHGKMISLKISVKILVKKKIKKINEFHIIIIIIIIIIIVRKKFFSFHFAWNKTLAGNLRKGLFKKNFLFFFYI